MTGGWSNERNEAIVAHYFSMLAKDIARRFNKWKIPVQDGPI